MKWGIMRLLLKISVISFVFLFQSLAVFAQSKNANVKIEYTKNRKINLGALSIDGEVVVPDDLSVEVDDKDFSLELYKRKDFKEKMNNNFKLFY